MSAGTLHTDISDRLRHIACHRDLLDLPRRSSRRKLDFLGIRGIFISMGMGDRRSVYSTHCTFHAINTCKQNVLETGYTSNADTMFLRGSLYEL